MAAARDDEISELISRTRCLTMEVEEFVESMRNTVLNGRTREEGQKLYDESSQCVREILMLKGVNLQPELVPLRRARGTLRQLCAESDNITAPAAKSPCPAPVPSALAGIGDGGASGRRPGPSDAFATIARAQLDYESARLSDDVLCDVSPDVKIKADKLRNLVKVSVPDVRKTVDRMREAMKAYAQSRDCEIPVLKAAQAKCERALDWITQVERRCEAEQIYLDQKQPAREVDFAPFASGTAVSIYEFFQRFEAWSRGILSLDTMAHVLYTKHLDKSITQGAKELEELKHSYKGMKAWLFRMYGRPDTIADLYLSNIRSVVPPANINDTVGHCRQVKEVYGHVVTLTTLEESEGKPASAVLDYVYRNQFLKALVGALPKSSRRLFMRKLEDEDLHVIEGRPYIRDILAILKAEYRRLEEEVKVDAQEKPFRKAVKTSTSHAVVCYDESDEEDAGEPTSSEDEDPAQTMASIQPPAQQPSKKKKSKKGGNGAQSANVAAQQLQYQPQPQVYQTAAAPYVQPQARPQQAAPHQPQAYQPAPQSRPQQQRLPGGGGTSERARPSSGPTAEFCTPNRGEPVAFPAAAAAAEGSAVGLPGQKSCQS